MPISNASRFLLTSTVHLLLNRSAANNKVRTKHLAEAVTMVRQTTALMGRQEKIDPDLQRHLVKTINSVRETLAKQDSNVGWEKLKALNIIDKSIRSLSAESDVLPNASTTKRNSWQSLIEIVSPLRAVHESRYDEGAEYTQKALAQHTKLQAPGIYAARLRNVLEGDR